MQIKCKICDQSIPAERLDAIETNLCVGCSEKNPQKLRGITVWDKTTPTLIIVDESEAQEFDRIEKSGGRLSRLK